MTDQDIIEFMSQSKDVQDWNKRREEVKTKRDELWIVKNLDSSGLIVKVLGKDIKNG